MLWRLEMPTVEAMLERVARAVCVERGLDPDSRPLKSSAEDPFSTNWQIEAAKLRDQFLVSYHAGLAVRQVKAQAKKATAA